MIKYFTKPVYLAVLLCWLLASCVFADSASLRTQPKLVSSQVESDFLVRNNKITINHGNQQSCNIDNEYLLSALELKNISIKNYDYDVTVRREQYETNSNLAAGPLELIRYSVKIGDLKNGLKREFPSLDRKGIIESYIPLSEAPTKCYVFTSNQELNLLCHYGLKRNSSIPGIITLIKEGN